MRVQKYLSARLGVADADKAEWVAHWLTAGFGALEPWLPADGGWCVGNAPTLADCCLVPQVANAQRAAFSLAPFPRVRRAYEHCAVVEATVQRARPVILTALAAILAFIPLTHSVFWGTLAYTLIGGTFAGTVLTLVFLPAMYAIWYRITMPADANEMTPADLNDSGANTPAATT
ncbi:GST C-terminal domain-containing protein [Cupriavidus necator]|uniref:GST C-terminal domain-containing protein n=1 Tax=Cupriavidus necator (strain ATCC 17699 / DSM 428 / KCTC 22496 / NCIMB 10442 / H16 / Stanier 337) TaxID=381666 RepID=Q0KAW7_CUPNH|nr:efflux RND transporter permease subunit [Cupriavidus necator]QCC00714.1 hypothetical protein E6A55_08780 [Cupriavidus necator H16]WKA42593.1 efflux RND transporter permease subunit [Cupriavidus necator]CAJ92854.1 conserved hypothetical protein [Cupriavidus necator H16]